VNFNVAPSVLASISGEQSFSYAPVPAGTVPRVTWSEAIASGASVPANVVAAQLLEITAPVTNGKPMLVWAIQESVPDGSKNSASAKLSLAPCKSLVSQARYNFRVDFVNANTGKLVFATEGHAPSVTTRG